MFRYRVLPAALLTFGLVAFLWADDDKPVSLAWQLKEPFTQQITTKTEGTLKAEGQPEVKHDLTISVMVSWTPVDATKSPVELKEKIEALSVKGKIGDEEISYDSAAAADKKGPLDEFLGPLVGASLTVAVDPKTMKVVEVKDGPDPAKVAAARFLTADLLKDLAQATFLGSDQPVKKGTALPAQEATLGLGKLGSYVAKTTYTCEAADAKQVRFKAAGDATFKPADGSEVKAIAPVKIEGSYDFDVEKGRVARMERKVEAAGTVELVADGKPVKVEVNLTKTMQAVTLAPKAPEPEKDKPKPAEKDKAPAKDKPAEKDKAPAKDKPAEKEKAAPKAADKAPPKEKE